MHTLTVPRRAAAALPAPATPLERFHAGELPIGAYVAHAAAARAGKEPAHELRVIIPAARAAVA